MKVISFKICPFVQRVTAILEAKGLDYDIEFISLSQKPDWFLEISPNGQVPVLITDDGTALFESDAIAEYIEDKYGPLIDGVSAEHRAQHRAWSCLASKHYLVQCSAQRSKDAETLAERRDKLRLAFGKIEKVLASASLSPDGPFFHGDMPGMVDMAWLVLLHRAAIIRDHSGYDFLDGFPEVQAWQQALLATGLGARSVAADFDQAFCDFYLSEETLLGRLGSDNDQADCCGFGSPAPKKAMSGGCC